MRNTKALVLAAAFAALALPGIAQTGTVGMNGGTGGTLSAADKLFVVRATDGNMAEVMTSQRALKKAGNSEVKQQVVSQALASARGGKFDQMYTGAQVEDHGNTIALFQQEIASDQDSDVKAYAAKCLPNIVAHTAMIYGAASGVGVPMMRSRPSTPPAAGMMMSPGGSTPDTGAGAGMTGGAGTKGQ